MLNNLRTLQNNVPIGFILIACDVQIPSSFLDVKQFFAIPDDHKYDDPD